MAETLTPKSISIQKQKPQKQKPQISSPTSPFFLSSNDDQLERAAARAARAAAFRRKPVEVRAGPRDSLSSDSFLDRHQIMELFQNCVKLASENKINQKNTWELKLIDHISEIIKVETEHNNAETNFQKASCTLETGVKIYAVRVDACHADAYRVLNGISRAGLEADNEFPIGLARTSKERDGSRPVSPLSTVESSFEPLNAKKFDGIVRFSSYLTTVDPLYYQTSAQFDEGGAKGLLLYNLGVYGGCRVLFDSQEIPAKCIPPTYVSTSSDLVDVSFAKGCIELMAANLHQKQDISPSLRDLIKQYDKFGLPPRMFDGTESVQNPNVTDANNVDFDVGKESFGTCDATEDMGFQLNDGSCDDSEAWPADHYDHTTISGEGINADIPTKQNYREEPMQFMSDEPVVDDTFDNVAWLFCRELGYKSARNAWAGPDHWIYTKPNGPENIFAHDSRSNCAAKRTKHKSSLELDIDFTRHLDDEVPNIFAPAKNPKSLLLPRKKVICPNKLPEDCHYQPEDLVKLFLLPDVLCLGKGRRRLSGSDSVLQGGDFDESFSSWDNCTIDDPFDSDFIQSGAEEDVLVSEPRQVGRIEVEYEKTSKQVDVHMLKETLWTLMQSSIQTPEVNIDVGAVSFRHLLTAIPDDCKAAATQDISPHLCFICLLHLANEHGLTIVGCPNLDDLSIHFSVACEETGEVIQASS
ncbi:Condensin complex subunit 2 [Bienertia sinuspersici]